MIDNEKIVIKDVVTARFLPRRRKSIKLKAKEIGPINPPMSMRMSRKRDCLLTTQGRVYAAFSADLKEELDEIYRRNLCRMSPEELHEFKKKLNEVSIASKITITVLLGLAGYGLWYYFTFFLPTLTD